MLCAIDWKLCTLGVSYNDRNREQHILSDGNAVHLMTYTGSREHSREHVLPIPVSQEGRIYL